MCSVLHLCPFNCSLEAGLLHTIHIQGARIPPALFYGMEVQFGFLDFDYWVCMRYLPYQNYKYSYLKYHGNLVVHLDQRNY